MACPTSVHSDLQGRRINITLSVWPASALLTVNDGKYWFRSLNEDIPNLEWAANLTPTHAPSTQGKLNGSLLHMDICRNLDTTYILIFISYELKSDECVYNTQI